MKWDQSLSIGIDSIDSQHKKLFDLIDQLQNAMGAGESRRVLDEIFTGLVDYTKEHFTHEAELFEKLGYERINEHLAKHEAFVRKLTELQSQFEQSSNFMIGVDVMTFMTDWLVSHIMGEDQKYVALFKENQVP